MCVDGGYELEAIADLSSILALHTSSAHPSSFPTARIGNSSNNIQSIVSKIYNVGCNIVLGGEGVERVYLCARVPSSLPYIHS